MPPRRTREEITGWALEVVRRLEEGRQTEDAFVELKAQWPADPLRAARRLAAHANSARGEPILWLIGVDERRGVVGVQAHEISTWWDQVENQFDRIAPAMTEVALEVPSGPAVVAVCFDTSERPFVVRTGKEDVDREIPWREGTRTRSARRSEILTMLERPAPAPVAAMVDGSLVARVSHGLEWLLVATVYLETDPSRTTIISAFDCIGEIKGPASSAAILKDFVFLRGMGQDDSAVQVVQEKAVFRAPGILRLRAVAESAKDFVGESTAVPLVVDLTLPISGSSTVVQLREEFQPATPSAQMYGAWVRPRRLERD
jgi:hypothetical protein